MIEINLIPDVKQELINAQRTRSSVITLAIVIGVISMIAVAVLAFYIFAVQSIRGGLLDGDIKTNNDKLSSVQDLSKILTIQNQLTKIDSLNNNKMISSRIFDLLGAIIPPSPNDIQISSLSVDNETQTITIEGQASNSYLAAEVFKKTIGSAVIKYTDPSGEKQQVALASKVDTNNTSYGEDSTGKKILRFTLSFNYAPELFAFTSKNLAIAISNSGNVTDSYLGVPKSIFVDSTGGL